MSRILDRHGSVIKTPMGSLVFMENCKNIVLEPTTTYRVISGKVLAPPRSAILLLRNCVGIRIVASTFHWPLGIGGEQYGICIENCTDVTIEVSCFSPIMQLSLPNAINHLRFPITYGFLSLTVSYHSRSTISIPI